MIFGCLCPDVMNIINLSSYPLNKDEEELLSLDHSFCPHSHMDKFTIIKDVYLFARRLLFM